MKKVNKSFKVFMVYKWLGKTTKKGASGVSIFSSKYGLVSSTYNYKWLASGHCSDD